MYLMTLPLFAALALTPMPSSNHSADRARSDCGDKIHVVREELGQPRLDREPASAEKPLLIAAVAKRIDGCAVMQMKGNVNDLRPLPAPADGPLLRPAK